jgi:hypothetical protein
MAQFRYIIFYWVPRTQNSEANDLAQMASGCKAAADRTDLQVHLLDQGDWRADIFNYLKDSTREAPKRIRYKAMRYILIGDDMFYRTLPKVCCSNAWGRLNPIGSYMKSMKAPVELINRLTR